MINIIHGIHPNSKINFIKEKACFKLEDLNELKEKKKSSDERVDIIGEVGINIFKEIEKCEQLLKYSKLIHNINYLIKNEEEDLSYLLDLLHLNGNNKKLLLFITDGSFSKFKNIKNNKFLKMQKTLCVDSLLIFRNKNSLFRTAYLEKLFKKIKKQNHNIFNENSFKEFETLMKHSQNSIFYEKVCKKLSEIEKKNRLCKK